MCALQADARPPRAHARSVHHRKSLQAASTLEPRTVYLGQVDPETTYEELCNVVHGGALENVKVRGHRQGIPTAPG